jgi:hypothetical protein
VAGENDNGRVFSTNYTCAGNLIMSSFFGENG